MDAGDIVYMGWCIYNTNRFVLIKRSDCKTSTPSGHYFVVFNLFLRPISGSKFQASRLTRALLGQKSYEAYEEASIALM